MWVFKLRCGLPRMRLTRQPLGDEKVFEQTWKEVGKCE